MYIRMYSLVSFFFFLDKIDFGLLGVFFSRFLRNVVIFCVYFFVIYYIVSLLKVVFFFVFISVRYLLFRGFNESR